MNWCRKSDNGYVLLNLSTVGVSKLMITINSGNGKW